MRRFLNLHDWSDPTRGLTGGSAGLEGSFTVRASFLGPFSTHHLFSPHRDPETVGVMEPFTPHLGGPEMAGVLGSLLVGGMDSQSAIFSGHF